MEMDWFSGYSQRSGFCLMSSSSCSDQAQWFIIGKLRQHSWFSYLILPFFLAFLHLSCIFFSHTGLLPEIFNPELFLNGHSSDISLSKFGISDTIIQAFLVLYFITDKVTLVFLVFQDNLLGSPYCFPPDTSGVWHINFPFFVRDLPILHGYALRILL